MWQHGLQRDCCNPARDWGYVYSSLINTSKMCLPWCHFICRHTYPPKLIILTIQRISHPEIHHSLICTWYHIKISRELSASLSGFLYPNIEHFITFVQFIGVFLGSLMVCVIHVCETSRSNISAKDSLWCTERRLPSWDSAQILSSQSTTAIVGAEGVFFHIFLKSFLNSLMTQLVI